MGWFSSSKSNDSRDADNRRTNELADKFAKDARKHREQAAQNRADLKRGFDPEASRHLLRKAEANARIAADNERMLREIAANRKKGFWG